MDAAVEEARARMPLAHVAMEHRWDAAPGAATTRGCRSSSVDGEVLATCDHHGPPVTLLR